MPTDHPFDPVPKFSQSEYQCKSCDLSESEHTVQFETNPIPQVVEQKPATEYDIVEQGSLEKLQVYVERRLAGGWEPQGGPVQCSVTGSWVQAMVRRV